MQEKISPPAAVRALDLVDAVWPAEEKPRPEVIKSRMPRYGVRSLLPYFFSAASCAVLSDRSYQCWLLFRCDIGVTGIAGL